MESTFEVYYKQTIIGKATIKANNKLEAQESVAILVAGLVENAVPVEAKLIGEDIKISYCTKKYDYQKGVNKSN